MVHERRGKIRACAACRHPAVVFDRRGKDSQDGHGGEPTVVLSSSHDGGTSALFQSSPNLVSMRFGPHSYRKHLRDACSKGVRVKLYYSKNLAMDIDTSEDLSTLLEVDRHTEFWKILGSIGLGSR